jgi:hydroxyacylglutathione hydrolase
MTLTIEQFTCRSDNYGVLVHDPDSGLTVSIDAPEHTAIRANLDRLGWKLDVILTTHHHADHTDGNLALKRNYGCRIYGPEGSDIPGRDEILREGDAFSLGAFEVRTIATPGHTLDHVSYWLPAAGLAFVGDTLFAIGCGRVIEGTMAMMWRSLERLMELPDETSIYCGHEYTEANARFAVTIEPENETLLTRAREVSALRRTGAMTLPTTIQLERSTNPFLRVGEPTIRQRIGMETASPAEVFAEIRRRKDVFR